MASWIAAASARSTAFGPGSRGAAGNPVGPVGPGVAALLSVATLMSHPWRLLTSLLVLATGG